MRGGPEAVPRPQAAGRDPGGQGTLEQVIDEQTPDQLAAGRLRRRGAGEGQVDADQLPAVHRGQQGRDRGPQGLYSRPYRAGLKFRPGQGTGGKANPAAVLRGPAQPDR